MPNQNLNNFKCNYFYLFILFIKKRLAWVQLFALGSKSFTWTRFFSKCDSCIPRGTICENLADGCDMSRCKLTAKPAMSMGNGRCTPHVTNQSTTLNSIFFRISFFIYWFQLNLTFPSCTIGFSYKISPTKATGHTDTFFVYLIWRNIIFRHIFNQIWELSV